MVLLVALDVRSPWTVLEMFTMNGLYVSIDLVCEGLAVDWVGRNLYCVRNVHDEWSLCVHRPCV